MTDLKKSMKLSLIFGFIGAALMPVIYEIYANVSMTAGLVFTAAWVLYAGVRFSSLGFKEAFVGITCTIAYSGILGWVCSLAIHPFIMDMLIKRSVYFQLTLSAQVYFVLYAFLIFICMYVIWLIRFGMRKAAQKLKSNREKAGLYIDNAFDDSFDGQDKP